MAIYLRTTAACLFSALTAYAHAFPVYENTFSGPESLAEFEIFGESFSAGFPIPSLNEVAIIDGQLVISTDFLLPNGPGNPPLLTGRAAVMTSSSNIAAPYNDVLADNVGTVEWSVNVSNQDGQFNNGFSIILGSNMPDPFDIAANGYVISGGGMVGDRLVLSRFDFGLGGGQETLVDITDGLSTLPEQGSLRVTFNPATNEWSLFGVFGSGYIDPTTVSHLLGSATDNQYAELPLSFFGLSSMGTGETYFDNLSIQIAAVAAPGSFVLLLLGLILVARSHYGFAGTA